MTFAIHLQLLICILVYLFGNCVVYQALPRLYSTNCPSFEFRKQFESTIIQTSFHHKSIVEDGFNFFTSPTKGCTLATSRTCRRTVVDFVANAMRISPTSTDLHRYALINVFLTKVICY